MLQRTSTPLTTFAAGGGSGGGLQDGGGTSVSVKDDALNDENVGLRFSLVTKDASGTRVVPNADGTYYFDVWSNTISVPDYNKVNTISRYSPLPTKDNITKKSVSSFDKSICNYVAKSGCTPDFALSDILKPGSSSAIFTEYGDGFGVYGETFYNWFMGTGATIGGVAYERYELVMNYLYQGCTSGLNPKNTFLVVEPIVNLCNVDDSWSTTGNRYIASWYGYLEYNINENKDPGRAHTVRVRLKKIGNGFRLADTAFTTDVEKRDKITEVLGVTIATGDPYKKVKHVDGDYNGYYDDQETEWFGPVALTGYGHIYNDIHLTVGLGMQAFWLSGTIDSGKPIDSYDITTSPQPQNVPTFPETPSEDNETDGTKTVIKLYCDLYKDPNSDYYTYIKDIKSNDANHPYAFVKTNTSNEVVITDEENINGYKVAGWYLSDTEYSASDKTNNAVLKASSMIVTTDLARSKSDGKTSLANLGGQQLRIDKYQPAYTSSNKAGFNLGTSGVKHFNALPGPHGAQGTGLNASASLETKTYYDYKRLEVAGTSNYGTYNFAVNEEGDKITLGDTDKTIVILYTRERTHISTDTTTVTEDSDDRKDNTGNLTIVKLYGILNPNSYEIVADPSKSSVVTKNATRNVNINSESVYTFAQWIYTTGGAPISLTASQMGSPNLTTFKLDKTPDQAYRLDGFVDNFKNNSGLEKYFRFMANGTLQLPKINIISTNNVNSNVTTGRFSYGSRSGIGTGSYNSTLYLGGDKLSDNTPDDTDTNDVLYLLFLKTDQLSYSADDLVIPESYNTRYDNYKHNPMTVTGSVSGKTYDEYLQAHKFKYVLPVVTSAEYKDINPLFISHIAKPSGLYFFALLQ